MTFREVELNCVSCATPLLKLEREGQHFARCPACQGTWMETAQLLSILRAVRPDKPLDELMVHNDGSPRRNCPCCGEVLNIAWLDFLQIDQCDRHGVWFDGGEFARAVSWDLMGSVNEQMKAVKAAELARMFRLMAVF